MGEWVGQCAGGCARGDSGGCVATAVGGVGLVDAAHDAVSSRFADHRRHHHGGVVAVFELVCQPLVNRTTHVDGGGMDVFGLHRGVRNQPDSHVGVAVFAFRIG